MGYYNEVFNTNSYDSTSGKSFPAHSRLAYAFTRGEGFQGYYDLANQNWSKPHDIGFTPTADAMTTNAALMVIRNIDSSYRKRFLTLADRITDKILPESYSSSTSPLNYEYSSSDRVPFGKELFNGNTSFATLLLK